MTQELPPPLKKYFAFKATEDIDAMVSQFSERAVVRDENQTHTGLAAIRAWMEEATRKYHDTAEVSDVSVEGEKVRVAALVSGNFPGSPVTLHFNFTLVGDRIGQLEIGS